MPLAKAYEFAAANGLKAEAEQIRSETQVDPGFKKGKQVRKARLLDLFEARNCLDALISAHWPAGATDLGRARRESYNRDRETNERLLNGEATSEGSNEAGHDANAEEQEFPLEADLRDFLAHNLSVIEPGLRLYNDNARTGIEFVIDDGKGRSDVLALDAGDRPVVIELKLSRGRNHTIGQLLYYMGWIDKNLGKGSSRGIIVAKEITPDLVLATERLSGVALFRYHVAMTVEPVFGAGMTQ
jgi:hypothetical protein